MAGQVVLGDVTVEIVNTERDVVDTPGVIGIASGFLGRYRDFDVCLNRAKMPEGSGVDWRVGVNIAYNYNNMIRTVLDDAKYQWLWILGDDHVFMPDLLMNLLKRDVDVVVPLCLRRTTPYLPVIFAGREGGYSPLGWDALNGKEGLVELETTLLGNAGMLIKRHVLETMDYPWFENGKMNPEMGGCDLWFCQKVHDAGIGLYLDTDNTIGHISHVAVWPLRGDNNIYTPELRTP